VVAAPLICNDYWGCQLWLHKNERKNWM